MKKLYKNEHDEVLTGVIGGIGEYFSVDPTVLRIAFVVLVLITGVFPGIIAYIIAYFLIPEKPHGVSVMVTPPPMKTPEPKYEPKVEPEPEIEPVAPAINPDPTYKAKPEIKQEPVVEAPKTPMPITEEESTVTVEDLMEPAKAPEPIGGEGELTEKVASSATRRGDGTDTDEPKTPTTL